MAKELQRGATATTRSPNVAVTKRTDLSLTGGCGMTTPDGRSRFGQIEGVNEGRIFDNRLDLSRAGAHAPTQNGISGTQTIGCDSIVLNGAYRDDDRGDVINYSGENPRGGDRRR